MPVNTERSDYGEMAGKWSRLRDCEDGRDAVLRAGAKYVPNLPGADAEGNKAYRERGNFYNAVKRTVGGMVGAIFQEPPEVEFPKSLEDLLKDITLTNVPFEMFALDAGKEVMLLARYGVLVDMPNVEKADNRPYLCGFRAEDIINWKTLQQGDDNVLSMVVLREKAEIPDKDEFCSKTIIQYRVIQLKDKRCVQQLWRETAEKSNEFVVFGEETSVTRRNVPLDFIPFVFIGATHATPDLETPPLLDLADVNLGHWRNSVDHEYGLHLIALPTPWVSGIKGQNTGPLKIGPSVVWELELQGQAGMLEFTGSGLGALVVSMDEKKKQMASLGARLLEDAAQTQETATAVRMRHSGETASLRTVASAIEQGFSRVLQIVGWWKGTEAQPVDVKANVELNKEYLNVKATPQEIQTALTSLQAGEISFETWYNLLSTGGWAREGIDAEAERKAIEEDREREPEPEIDPELSPGEVDPKNPIKPGSKKKVVRDGTGKVKYEIEETV